MIGKLLNNRYEIVKLIGQGGMATVYLGFDKKLSRNVAIKILKEEFLENEQFLKKFSREAQSAAKLSHSNIVNVYDVGNDGDIHYIVMEYIDGKTLKDYIKSKGKLSYRESINYALGIASALSHAHKNNIIHRDIKPHNILIVSSNKMPKVADFGIAKAITSSTLTMTEDTMGSVHYISPEQARGGFLDARSDLYSLGILIYEMLTGHVPFVAESSVAVALKQIQEPMPRLKDIDDNIPEGLSMIVENLTQKSPADRYQSADELIIQLKNLRQDFKYNVKSTNVGESNATEVMPMSDDTGEKAKVKYKKNKPKSEVLESSDESSSDNAADIYDKNKKIIKIGIVAVAVVLLCVIGFVVGGSLFAKEVVVPYVVDKTLDDAEKEFSALGLKYEIIEHQNSLTVPPGSIISQIPESGTKLKTNKKVQIVVSDGPRIVKMPNVVGKDEIGAKEALESEGLVVGEIIREFSDKYDEGLVFNQSVKPDTEIKEGSEVAIYVSKGEDVVVVVKLIGKTLKEAKAWINEQDLKLGSVTYETSTSYAKDTIISQSIAGYEKVPRETTIDLVVSKGKITSKSISFDMSNYTGGDPKNIHVKIEYTDADGESSTIFNASVSGTTIVTRTVRGYDKGSCDVYIDGVYKDSVSVSF